MYLQKIIDYKREELAHLKRKISLADVKHKAEDTEPARRFLDTVAASGIQIIAEIKKASPSAGIIRADFDPLKIAQIYEENGAAALSVLTDEHFFQGSLEHLTRINQRAKIPLLRKDFTFDEYQIYEARGAGADAVLLIVRILEKNQIRDYATLAQELGMAALVEVHNSEELKRAKEMNAQLIGINNRDLDTFKVDLETTVKLAKEAPKDAVLISESGISMPDHIKKLKDCGVHAFLIGESLLRHKNPGEKLKELLNS